MWNQARKKRWIKTGKDGKTTATVYRLTAIRFKDSPNGFPWRVTGNPDSFQSAKQARAYVDGGI